MSNVQRLNYFVENETAETATKSFALILQKAYEQYRKLWNKYLDLVKKCGVDNSVHNEIQEAWKKEDVLKTIHAFAEDTEFLKKSGDREKIRNSEKNHSFIDNVSDNSIFDLMMDVNDTIYQSQPNTVNVILPESPIFMRRDEKSRNSSSRISTNSKDKSILDTTEIDDKSDFNKHNTSKNTFSIRIPEENLDDMSLDNLSPFVIQSTPVVNNKLNKKSRKKLFKKANQQQLNDDKVTPKKKNQTEKSKMPLQTLDNISNSLSSYLIHDKSDQTNNKIDNKKSTFYNTKKNFNNTTLSSTNENVPITRFTKSRFIYKPSVEDIVKENKTVTDEKINVICLENANDNNETIFEDVITNSPDRQKEQLQNKNRLKLKQISKTIKASASTTNNLMQMQNNECPIKKRNIDNDNSSSSSETSINNAEKKYSIFFQDIESDKKLVDKNNSERIPYKKQKKSNKFNEFQCNFENDTYFEEKTPKKSTTSVNKMINKNLLRHENMGIDAIKCNSISKAAKKDVTMKNKRWACWECEEYYKSETGISNTQMQKRKDQCSRHKNPYYAKNATPPGFWDPFLPSTISDSAYQY